MHHRFLHDWKRRQIQWMQSQNVHERAWAWITQEHAQRHGFDCTTLNMLPPYFAFLAFRDLARELDVDPQKILAEALQGVPSSRLHSDAGDTADSDEGSSAPADQSDG